MIARFVFHAISRLILKSSLTARTFSRESPRIRPAAWRHSSTKKDKTLIAINQNSEYWKNQQEKAEKLHSIGYTSTPHKDHAIIHELGHARHYKKLGQDDYDEIRRKPINEKIAAKVSRYATTNPSEFVAETYAGLMTGQKYDKEVMDYYAELNGPVVEFADADRIEHFSISQILELFNRNPCGDSAGGFERGNSCQRGGKGHAETLKKLTKLTSKAEKELPRRPRKAFGEGLPQIPQKETGVAKPAGGAGGAIPGKNGPSSPGASVSAAQRPNKSTSAADTLNGGAKPKKETNLNERSVRAIAAYKPVTDQMRKDATAKELEVARALGAQWLSDNEPPDTVKVIGKRRIGIDVKTMFDNGNDKLTVEQSSNFNKVKWIRSGQGDSMHTVIIDHNTGDIYYKRGYGSYRVPSMYKVSNYQELNRLIELKDGDPKLPHSAKMPTSTEFYKAITTNEGYKKLEEKAKLREKYNLSRFDKSKLKKAKAMAD